MLLATPWSRPAAWRGIGSRPRRLPAALEYSAAAAQQPGEGSGRQKFVHKISYNLLELGLVRVDAQGQGLRPPPLRRILAAP
eukprot:492017-Alexandrium_andersonii.AAC.1